MKKNKKYRQKRSEENLLDLLDNEKEVIEELQTYYDKALRDINKSIEALYGRFQDQNDLTKKEALALIKGQEYRVWRMTMDEYMDKIEKTNNKALLLELNTLAMRKRINRLEALEAEILAHSAIIAQKEDEVIKELLSNSLEDSYYKSMYEEYLDKDPDTIKLMQENKVKLSKENINRVLSLPWSGKNYSENIWDNSYFIAKKVKTMIAKNIIGGKSVQNLTRELTKIYGKQYRYNAQRLIRTELAYVKGQADILTYDKLNIDKYEILATLDNRTSSICQSMDGKVFPISDIKIGINYPPFHPNCRTTTVKYRENTENKTRLAKDASGKNVKLPFNMKYDEWKRWVEKQRKNK